jgi:hypothetical protein
VRVDAAQVVQEFENVVEQSQFRWSSRHHHWFLPFEFRSRTMPCSRSTSLFHHCRQIKEKPRRRRYVFKVLLCTVVLLYCCTVVLLYCCTVVLLYCCCALPLLCIAGLTLLLLFARRKRHFGWFGISQFEFGRFFVSECHHSSIFGTCSLGDWGSGRSFECFLFEATGRLLLPWFATALWYLNTRRWTTHLFLFSCFLVFVVCLFVCSGGTRLWRPTLFVPVPVHCCRICCEARHCNL